VTAFSDVPPSHPFAPDIAWMVERGITHGHPDGTFRPAEPVSRGQMAAFLHRFAGAPAFAPPRAPSFGDVPTTHTFFREVEWLADAGIALGSAAPGGPAFRPGEGVARQQMASFLHRFAGSPAYDVPLAPTFVDVPAGSTTFTAVEWLVARRITVGTRGRDGVLRFDPTGSVTRGQMAAFLHRFDGPAEQPEPDPDAYTGNLHHLLRRATYGVTPELLADVNAAGSPAAWLEQQLDPATIDDATCDAALSAFPLIALTPPELDRRIERFSWPAMFELQAATLARATVSRRQLFEVMVEFWSNHLNITCPSSDVWATKPWDDLHVVRRHALGRFEDMLVASMTSPAMLHYLDGTSSRGEAPNENYGRELLELHTVGRESGYTRDDVVGAARALTGLSVWDPWNGGTEANLWTVRYRPDWHFTGRVSVLGWSHENTDPEGGVAVAQSLAHYLARHPATAQQIARKLAVRFVADEPPTALVDRLAGIYLASGTDVVPVLRALLLSPEFAGSVGQKVRRPYEDAVATLRATGAQVAPGDSNKGWRDLVWQVGQCGQAPMSWAPPDGYPDIASAWAGTGSVLARWNLHIAVTGRWMKDGIAWPDLLSHLLPEPASTRDALVQQLFDRLLPGLPVPTAHRDALVTFLDGPDKVHEADVSWLFRILVALVLDSPHWSIR
jgi:uncharacterized protein (DUF1800 family)